jgi:hypothetical protein
VETEGKRAQLVQRGILGLEEKLDPSELGERRAGWAFPDFLVILDHPERRVHLVLKVNEEKTVPKVTKGNQVLKETEVKEDKGVCVDTEASQDQKANPDLKVILARLDHWELLVTKGHKACLVPQALLDLLDQLALLVKKDHEDFLVKEEKEVCQDLLG